MTDQNDCALKGVSESSLPVSFLHVDEAYQRQLSTEFARKIASEFLPPAFDRILVGHRADDTHWVVDGQTRLEAAKMMGWQSVPCRVFESQGQIHEAEIFRQTNLTRRSMKAFDVYHAALAAGDPDTLALRRSVERHGFMVAYKSTWPHLRCVSKLYRCQRYGVLNEVLVSVKCWEPDVLALSETCVGGLADFWKMFPDASIERCVERWRRSSVVKLVQGADGAKMSGGNRYRGFALVLMEAYNKGLRSSRLIWPFASDDDDDE